MAADLYVIIQRMRWKRVGRKAIRPAHKFVRAPFARALLKVNVFAHRDGAHEARARCVHRGQSRARLRHTDAIQPLLRDFSDFSRSYGSSPAFVNNGIIRTVFTSSRVNNNGGNHGDSIH